MLNLPRKDPGRIGKLFASSLATGFNFLVSKHPDFSSWEVLLSENKCVKGGHMHACLYQGEIASVRSRYASEETYHGFIRKMAVRHTHKG